MIALEIIFWLSLASIVYVYLFYPLIIWLFGRIIPPPVIPGSGRFAVSVVIPAYNEEEEIGGKVGNILGNGYPPDLLEVLVASDASSDRTEEIVRGLASEGVKLLRFEDRLGKSEMINRVIPLCRGEIVIVTDADTRSDPGSIAELIAFFSSEDVGAVCGKRGMAGSLEASGAIADGLYCRYESFIKKQEGRLLSIMGADGSLYAFRKKLFVRVPPDVPDDFAVILEILKKKMGVVYADRAISREEVFSSVFREYRRKVRTIARGIRGAIWARSLLNPFRYPLPAFQLLSHKIYRWLVPGFLASLFASNLLLLGNPFYLYPFIAQTVFYASAGAGMLLEFRRGRAGCFLVPAYFVLMNLASLAGILAWLRGQSPTHWARPAG